jgi:hypothetical protein
MSNTFITPSQVIRDANLVLKDDLIIGNLVNRNIENTFATKVGSTIKVKVPPTMSASEFSSSTSAANVTETSTDVTLEKHFYVRVDLTSDELTQSLDDFNTVVTLPAVRGLTASIESYFMQRILGGFNRYLVGTSGNEPSTHAHILAAEKKIFDNKGDTNNLVGLIDSTAHASFAGLNIFTSSDYGVDRPAGLQTASLGKLAGANWFRSPNATSLTQTDVVGTILVKGGSQTGTTLITDGYTGATGTVPEGVRFTVAGVSGTYTVTKDATIALSGTNTATLTITPALASAPADDAALTIATAAKACVLYNPMAVAAAIIPGAIVGPNVAAASINGLGLRIISDVSVSTLAGTWVFDLYAGCRVVRPEYGAVMQG